MSIRRHTRVLSVILLPLSALNCGEGSLTEDLTRALDSADEECVSSPDELMAVPAAPCEFDQGALTQTCVRGALGREVVETSRFASVEDYVEAAGHLGKLTSLEQIRIERGATIRTALSYDEVGRLTRSVELAAAGNVVHQFSEYDALDRPLRATLTGAGLAEQDCAGYAISFAYADDAGIISRHIQPLSADCEGEERTEFGYSTLPSGVEHQLCL
jgi:hypothetical protein